jgi:multiple sugar transport system ATP-binding protein
MGSELYAYFDVKTDAEVRTAELDELAKDAGMEELPQHGGDAQQVVARLSSASRARPSQNVNLVLDTTRLQLFDPAGGRSLMVG